MLFCFSPVNPKSSPHCCNVISSEQSFAGLTPRQNATFLHTTMFVSQRSQIITRLKCQGILTTGITFEWVFICTQLSGHNFINECSDFLLCTFLGSFPAGMKVSQRLIPIGDVHHDVGMQCFAVLLFHCHAISFQFSKNAFFRVVVTDEFVKDNVNQTLKVVSAQTRVTKTQLVETIYVMSRFFWWYVRQIFHPFLNILFA